jgi:sugar phosphate isomerase/epimerase
MSERRSFLKKCGALAAGSLLFNRFNAQSMLPINEHLDSLGVQLFSIPKILEKDFAGTMKMVAQKGYKKIEFYGPYSFSAEEDKKSWESVTPSLGFSGSGYFGHTPQEAKKILDDNGLSSPSMHTGLNTLHKKMDEMAETAHIVGHQYVILPSAATPADLDGYKRLADEFNQIGAEAKKRGLRFAYHNHGNGLKAIDGIIPLDLLLERTDPELVFMQMDIYWTTAGGIDPVAYLDKYPGRYRLMHIKDMAKKVSFSGDGGTPNQWIELFPYLADAGSGVLDLKSILSHAKKSGVEHFIVERDLAPNPDEALEKAYKYLSQLNLNS